MMTGSVLTVHSSTHYLVVMMALHYCETRPLCAKTSSQLTTHLLLAAPLAVAAHNTPARPDQPILSVRQGATGPGGDRQRDGWWWQEIK